MLKYILSLVLLFTLCTTGVYAQAAKGNGKSDPEAKKVLDAVSAKFKTFKSVKASFTLKIENAAGKVQGTKTGTVLMKGMKYRGFHYRARYFLRWYNHLDLRYGC